MPAGQVPVHAVTTKSKQRGTQTETMVVRYLRQWWPEAERRVQHGSADQGDVINIPRTCLEIKGDRENRLPKWKGQTLAELRNSGEDFCALVVRVERRPVDQWECWMPLWQLGIPVFGEDAWCSMPLVTGVEVLRHLQAVAPPYFQPSSGTTE